MALSSKLTSIGIRQKDFNAANDWQFKFTINNMISEIGQVNYGSAFDEAVDGSLRHNIRGYRTRISLSFEKLLSSTAQRKLYGGAYSNSTVSTFLTDVIDALITDQDNYIEISLNINESSPSWFSVVPENMSLVTAYTNQIGRGSANLNFVGRSIITSIPAELQAPSV